MRKINRGPLGERLWSLRIRDNLSLRAVERITKNKVSNAYLSQLETGKIKRPSPEIIFSLAEAYSFPYDVLMEIAGYASARGSSSEVKITTNYLGKLTEQEEKQLTEYLAFLRSKK